MDFANERYVRLYTRDTTTTKLLGWQGRTVLWHLLRKLDRSGVLELEGCEPWEVAVLHGDLPEDIARDGMARLLTRGCLVHDGDRLVAPRYIEANETPASDALRARESRERRAALSVTKRDGYDSIRDAAITERDQTSRSVTPRHEPSRDVTPCRAVPSHADPSVPNRAVPSDSRARWAVVLERIRAVHGGIERFDPGSYREALDWIGAKPDVDLGKVLTHYAADDWVKANPGRANPNHIRKHWDKYLDGPTKEVSNGKAPIKAKTAAEYEMPKDGDSWV